MMPKGMITSISSWAVRGTYMVLICPYKEEYPGNNNVTNKQRDNAKLFIMPQRYKKIFYTFVTNG